MPRNRRRRTNAVWSRSLSLSIYCPLAALRRGIARMCRAVIEKRHRLGEPIVPACPVVLPDDVPVPEAFQLATEAGWRLRRGIRGAAAGLPYVAGGRSCSGVGDDLCRPGPDAAGRSGDRGT